MKTVATRLRVADAFRETEKAWGFALVSDDGRPVDLYVPKSQAEVDGLGRLRVAPWLRIATFEKQGVSL